jgi:hypothetical protein
LAFEGTTVRSSRVTAPLSTLPLVVPAFMRRMHSP